MARRREPTVGAAPAANARLHRRGCLSSAIEEKQVVQRAWELWEPSRAVNEARRAAGLWPAREDGLSPQLSLPGPPLPMQIVPAPPPRAFPVPPGRAMTSGRCWRLGDDLKKGFLELGPLLIEVQREEPDTVPL
jgi:hypothetical protein